MKKIVILVLLLVLFVPVIAYSQEFISEGNAEEKAIFESGEKYVLVVGVSKFKDSWIDEVSYSVNDAKKVRNTLIQVLNYKEENISMLLNDEATLANIVSELNTLRDRAVNKDDTVMFFYSGHGIMIRDENFIFPYDTRVSGASDDKFDKQTILGVEEIVENILYSSPAKKILLLDACRKIIEDKSFGSTTTIDFERTGLAKDNDNVIIVSSTEKDNLAYESKDPKIRNSIFTYSFVSSMRDKNTDLNKSKYVSLDEILTETKKKMESICKNENAPIIQRPSINAARRDLLEETIISEAILGFVPPDIDPSLEEINFDEIISENSDSFNTAVKNEFDNLVKQFKGAINDYEGNEYKKALEKYEELKDTISNISFYVWKEDDPEKAKPFIKLYEKADEAVMKLHDYFDKAFLNNYVTTEFDKVKFCQEVYTKSYSSYWESGSDNYKNTELLINGRYLNMVAIVVMEDLLDANLERDGRNIPLPNNVKDAVISKISELKGHLIEIEKQLVLDCNKNKDEKEYYDELVDILRADVNQNENYKKRFRKTHNVTDTYKIETNERVKSLKGALDKKADELDNSFSNIDSSNVTSGDLDDLEDKLDDLTPKTSPGYSKSPHLNKISREETDILWEASSDTTSKIIINGQVKADRVINRFEISTAELIGLMGNRESITIEIISVLSSGKESKSSVKITKSQIRDSFITEFESNREVKRLKEQLKEAKEDKDYNTARKVSNKLLSMAGAYNKLLDSINIEPFKIDHGRTTYIQAGGGIATGLIHQPGLTVPNWNVSLNLRLNPYFLWGFGIDLFSPELFIKVSLMNNYNPLDKSFPLNELYIKIGAVGHFWPEIGIGATAVIGDIIRFTDVFGASIGAGINMGLTGDDMYFTFNVRLGLVLNI